MIKYGRRWETSNGDPLDDWEVEKYILANCTKEPFFKGRKYHFKEAMKALMPWFQWHKWSTLVIDNLLDNRENMIMGPGSSGKTYSAAAYAYTCYQLKPIGTGILISSTTRQGLQLRIWGAIKQIHKDAKRIRPHLPGRVIDSSMALTHINDYKEGTDLRQGIIGVAAKSGSEHTGLKNYVGFKNEHVILIADELALMPENFLDPVANLRKNPRFELIGLFNPKDRNDVAGKASEPLVGWDNIEPGGTKTWKTKVSGRVAVQLDGFDTPNGDYPRGQNPYKGLITPEQIEADAAQFGENSIQFQMMNRGIMPKMALSHRVITVPMCESSGAFHEAVWGSPPFVDVIGIDASYSLDHGDRTCVTHLRFGDDSRGKPIIAVVGRFEIPLENNKTSAEQQIVTGVKDYCVLSGVAPENVGFDSTGRGTLALEFARAWSYAVNAIEFGGKAPNRPTYQGSPQLEVDAYANMVTALWYASRKVVEQGQMRQLPMEYVEEASMREIMVVGKTKIQVEPKPIMKKRLKCSPDLWDSMVVAIEMARKRGFQITGMAVSSTDKPKHLFPSWVEKRSRSLAKAFEKAMLIEE
jgi:hypothetical protein